MKVFVAAVFIVLLCLSQSSSARHISRQHSHHGHSHQPTEEMRRDIHDDSTVSRKNSRWERRPMKRSGPGPDTLQVAGSKLPDCSHACGSCRPCRLIMVSFVCASLQEAETCPMAYKCMCHHKSYPVP